MTTNGDGRILNFVNRLSWKSTKIWRWHVLILFMSLLFGIWIRLASCLKRSQNLIILPLFIAFKWHESGKESSDGKNDQPNQPVEERLRDFKDIWNAMNCGHTGIFRQSLLPTFEKWSFGSFLNHVSAQSVAVHWIFHVVTGILPVWCPFVKPCWVNFFAWLQSNHIEIRDLFSKIGHFRQNLITSNSPKIW